VNTLIKTPEQIEVAEIFSRLKTGGLSFSDVARELQLERSYISMLASGKRNPPPRTLQQIRELERRLKNAKPPADPREASELELLFEQIELIERYERDNFEVIKKVVELAAPKGPKRRYTLARPGSPDLEEASSKPVSDVDTLVKSAVKAVEHPPVVYGRKRKAV
jgi:transcriptional regulator with XRE-family HTH domain